MEIGFIDLGVTECDNKLVLNRLQVKYGSEWSELFMYSFEFTFGCSNGDFTLFQNKSDLINHLIGERDNFKELFPEHFDEYLNVIEAAKAFKQ